MDGENLKKLSLSTILIAAILLTYTMAFTPSVRADNPVVSVLPAIVDIAAVGQTQSVDINITDVMLMYAYEIKIWYLNSFVNTTVANVVRPTGHLLTPEDPTKEFVAAWTVNNAFNATHGRIHVAYSMLAPEFPRNGTGILVRITFTGVAVGSTEVVLANYPGANGPVKISDNEAIGITHTVSNGTINVIPESMLLLPIFAVTSLIAVSIAKLRKKKQFQ